MYCYIRLAWLSRTSIAVTSGRINQNSFVSRKYSFIFRTSRNWLSRQDQCQTRKSSRLHFVLYRNLEIGPSSYRGRSLGVATPNRPYCVRANTIYSLPLRNFLPRRILALLGRESSYLYPLVWQEMLPVLLQRDSRSRKADLSAAFVIEVDI